MKKEEGDPWYVISHWYYSGNTQVVSTVASQVSVSFCYSNNKPSSQQNKTKHVFLSDITKHMFPSDIK